MARFAVGVGVADITPVSLGGIAEQCTIVFQHQREKILGKIEVFTFRNVGENFRLQYVNAGVDGVGDDLAPARLFQELGNALRFVGDNNAELERILDRGQGDGGFCLVAGMEINSFSQVEVGQQISADNKERLVQIFLGSLYRPGGSKILQRRNVGDFDPEIGAVSKEVFDNERLVVKQHYQVGDIVLFQEFHDMQHDRAVEQRNHRFGKAAGKWLNSGPEPAGHDDGFHVISFF